MRNFPIGAIVAVTSVAGLAGFAAYTLQDWTSSSMQMGLKVEAKSEDLVIEQVIDEPVPATNSVALRYARAVQQRDCDDVIRMTQWMRERLEYVALSGGNQEAARSVLCNELQENRREDNLLQPEGIEDKYVFAPDAKLVTVAIGEGQSGLEGGEPVLCEWIEVTYAGRDQALRDAAGKPIHSIEVGVNVSGQGYILKAGIVGNLDINFDSIAYDWPE